MRNPGRVPGTAATRGSAASISSSSRTILKPTTPGLTHRRCAIYTRKSSEEGLEQAFNSLDAQREACEAYIKSQRHEGWVLLPTFYDDGGISGGTLERPALQRLLLDISAGRVDLVIVYKVDRLTRSLADFAKIVEVFDAKGASFVSVTQQFNTATSMGRLTLNMLLSFAQFEREVTGERIRDKIAASKRKGMWMGGAVPLGYDVQDRKLLINVPEAEIVRHIYRTYLQLGSVRLLKQHLAEQGVRSKLRPDAPSEKMRGGRELARGALYTILRNRLYRGEIAHQGNIYPGEHDAIIDLPLWDQVQQRLTENQVEHDTGVRATNPSLLAGLIFDPQGVRLTPTHAVKKGRRYRYYVSKQLQTASRAEARDGMRIPAGDLERAVNDRLVSFLGDRTAVFEAIRDRVTEAGDQHRLLERAEKMAVEWRDHARSQRKQVLHRVLADVTVHPDHIDLRLQSSALLGILDGTATANQLPRYAAMVPMPVPMQMPADDVNSGASADAPQGHLTQGSSETLITLSLAVTLRRAGLEMRLLVQGAQQQNDPDPTLLKLLARAHRLRDQLFADGGTIHALAEREQLNSSYATRVLRLAYLAPDIVSTILAGRQPTGLTAQRLVTNSRLPLSWAAQRQLLGFA